MYRWTGNGFGQVELAYDRGPQELITFCCLHSLHARLTAACRAALAVRSSWPPLSWSSSLSFWRLKPCERVLAGLFP
jgi:hypothetical protein